MNKPKKSLRVREITAWHSADFSPHAGPQVRTHQCERSLFIHVWTFGAGPECGTRSADPHARTRQCECTLTRGLIGRVRSANICGGRKLHKYVSTNVWTMKNVSTQQMSRSVRYMTLQSGTVALRWLFSCWNKHGRLSRDQSPSGHVRSQAISCLANRSHHAYVLMH